MRARKGAYGFTYAAVGAAVAGGVRRRVVSRCCCGYVIATATLRAAAALRHSRVAEDIAIKRRAPLLAIYYGVIRMAFATCCCRDAVARKQRGERRYTGAAGSARTSH